MKIPLLIQNEARDPNRAKDSWAINCFLEQDDFARAVKRPGLTRTVDGTELGVLGQGVFIWPSSDGPIIATIVDDILWLYNDDYEIEDAVDLETEVSLIYDSLASYTAGDRVLYTYGPIVPDGWTPNVVVLWYCIANVSGIAPAHSSAAYAYWSLYPNKPTGTHPTITGTLSIAWTFPPFGGPIAQISDTIVTRTDNTGNYTAVYTGRATNYNPPYPNNAQQLFENYGHNAYTLINGTVDYYNIINHTSSELPLYASNDYVRSFLV